MKNRSSKAVEILPHAFSEYAIGSTKHNSCRVCKNGRNIAMPKIKQPNKEGRDPLLFTNGSAKWKTLSHAQKENWRDIAIDKEFWSKWQAFMSSFLISVTIHGMDYTMNHELSYIDSEARHKRYEYYENSIKRNQQYKVDPSYYPQTEAMLKLYPIAHDSELLYIRLLDLIDINNALQCKMVYRTDPFVEYEYYPEQTGAVEKGYYIRRERPRQGDELYELLRL